MTFLQVVRPGSSPSQAFDGVAVPGAIDLFEIFVWLRWRKRRSTTGEEGLVGARGVALTDLSPEGQIKLRGTFWKARASAPIGPGDEVIVTATEGMTLQVERLVS